MQKLLRDEIKRLSRRIFKKQQIRNQIIKQHCARIKKRSGNATSHTPYVGKYPTDTFDPRFCARNANILARTIWHKVQKAEYHPEPAVCYHIPKPHGGTREVMAFSIPDAALANVIFKRIMERNINIFSPFSFAYHPQKNLFDAILSIKEYEHGGKLFVIQIDFKKYFDTIPTRYLQDKLKGIPNLILRKTEKYIILQFMYHKFTVYNENNSKVYRRHKGVPQGSSLSLFLANLANHDLDLALTSAAGRFVRYADDVVAVCSNYTNAQHIEQCFFQHCKQSGLQINTEKSPGIAILSAKEQELRTISYFDYLGYRFTPKGLTLPDSAVVRLKKKISRLINLYLLHYIKNSFNKNRCNVGNRYDWDLFGLICELRRCLYGGLKETQLHEFLTNNKYIPRMKGLMGFYCLIEDPTPLKVLDGWMLSTIRRAMRVRNKKLKEQYQWACPTPTDKQLLTGEWLSRDAWREEKSSTREKLEPQIPSLMRAWQAARKYRALFGTQNIEAPKYPVSDAY